MKNAWIHVDGAFGMWARACPSRAHLARDLNKADSWATDGHKWLQTPHDCGYAIVRDADAHRRAMTIAGSCLPTVGEGERDPSHFVPEFSRRARGFATWAMLRHLGREGIAAMVSEHCRLARRMAERLTIEPGIKVLNEVALNQVIVRFGISDDLDEGNRLTAQVIKTLQADGTLFLSGAEWHGE
jgi:glutamate/tyrosine decarboxylase-like PLP-dependent enzyme